MSSAQDQVEALYAGLSGFLHPNIGSTAAIQLVCLAVLYATSTALYAFALVYEVSTKWKSPGALWLFRIANEARGRYVMVNVFFLWMPLAGIYTAAACVSCWWHHHNDQGSGSQKGNVAFAVIPLLFLELAAWLGSCTLLFSGFHLIGAITQSSRGRFNLRVPPPWVYHFMLFGLPAILMTTAATLGLIGNSYFNKAVDTATSLVSMIDSGDINFVHFLRDTTIFGDQTAQASFYGNTAGYVALGMLTVLVIMCLPASVVLMIAMRRSAVIRSENGAADSAKSSMQRLLVFYGCYAFAWSISVIVYQYYNTAQKLSDNGISYAVDMLVPMYLHGFFNLGGAIYLSIRTVVSTKVVRQSSHGTSDRQSRKGVHVLTQTNIHRDDEDKYKSRASLDYEDKQVGLDIALEHVRV